MDTSELVKIYNAASRYCGVAYTGGCSFNSYATRKHEELANEILKVLTERVAAASKKQPERSK